MGIAFVLCLTCALIADEASRQSKTVWRLIRSWIPRVIIVAKSNLHDEKEAEPVRCLACMNPAMLLFGEDDVLRVVCRNKQCQYTEVV